MPYAINETTVNSNIKAEAMEAMEVIAGLSPEGLVVGVPTVGPAIHPKSARHMAKNAFTVIRKDISVSIVTPSNVEYCQDPV